MAEDNYSLESTPYSVESGYTVTPESPKTETVETTQIRRKRRKDTAFHKALFSFGAKGNTQRLSEEELHVQIAEEVGYLGNLGYSYLESAGRTFVDLLNLLFCK